jgi:CheY-like chemotaxis protein
MKPLTLGSPLIYTFSRLYHSIKTKSDGIRHTLILLATLAGKKSIRILLADDDHEDVEVFTEVLREIAPQVDVTVAANGHELMRHLAKQNRPDIIFLDLNMPLKNGQECLEEIRADKRFKGIPVIIYSTSSSHQHINDTFKGGANFYITKPDSYSDLKLIVKKLFELDWEKHVQPVRERFVLNAGQIRRF